jgi:hypothetical protein
MFADRKAYCGDGGPEPNVLPSHRMIRKYLKNHCEKIVVKTHERVV